MTLQNQGELFKLLHAMNRDIGELKGTLETFVQQMKVQDERATGLEVRTRKVEKWQHFYSGAGAIVGAILGALGMHAKAG